MGRYPAWTRKVTIEDSHILSIFALSRHGIVRLDGAAAGVWTWDQGRCQIGYRRIDCHLWLDYTVKGQAVTYAIKLDSIPLRWNNGSYRLCFLCPNRNCQRRVYKLYLPPHSPYFYCRQCHHLGYDSRLYHPGTLCYRMVVMEGIEQRVADRQRPKNTDAQVAANLR